MNCSIKQGAQLLLEMSRSYGVAWNSHVQLCMLTMAIQTWTF